jgi:hypothetical protein
LPIDFFDELENKIDGLIARFNKVKEENVRLTQQLKLVNSQLSDSESETETIKTELESLITDSQERQGKLNTAAEKIQGLLARLETLQD